MQKIELSNEVSVIVHTTYVPEESSIEDSQYVFAYKIRLINNGSQPVKLVSRHWIISDGYGNKEEVRGLGVVGEQPILKPGDSYEYGSFCPLPTPTGSMNGSYLMVRDDGTQFLAQIPIFYLVEPNSLN